MLWAPGAEASPLTPFLVLMMREAASQGGGNGNGPDTAPPPPRGHRALERETARTGVTWR